MTFNKHYAARALVLFIIEVMIALFVHDDIVRPYVGDVLVVILIYCFIRSFLVLPFLPVALSVLLFSFTLEFLQYIRIVEKLGLNNSALARTLIGTSFAWIDLLAYSIGIIIVLTVEESKKRKVKSRKQKVESRK